MRGTTPKASIRAISAPNRTDRRAPGSDAWVWRRRFSARLSASRRSETEAEAIQLANDSRYGLAAAVMSKDDVRTERVASAFRAGIVWINCSQPTFTEAPWGGYKESGIGRELGRWGLENYLETKQITKYVTDTPGAGTSGRGRPDAFRQDLSNCCSSIARANSVIFSSTALRKFPARPCSTR